MIEKKVLMFEKHTGEFIAEIYEYDLDRFNVTDFKIKSVEYDEDIHKWDGGNYIQGKLISKEELSRRIYEIGMNGQCRNVILAEYPTDDQINNITSAILDMASSLNLSTPAIDKLLEQKLFIGECLDANKRYIKAYKEDPYWEFIGKNDKLDFLKSSPKEVNSEELGVHSIDL